MIYWENNNIRYENIHCSCIFFFDFWQYSSSVIFQWMIRLWLTEYEFLYILYYIYSYVSLSQGFVKAWCVISILNPWDISPYSCYIWRVYWPKYSSNKGHTVIFIVTWPNKISWFPMWLSHESYDLNRYWRFLTMYYMHFYNTFFSYFGDLFLKTSHVFIAKIKFDIKIKRFEL